MQPWFRGLACEENFCPKNCSGRGTCLRGKCECKT